MNALRRLLFGPAGARRPTLAALALAALAGCVRPTDRPLLWRIDAERPCYLYGTMHVPDTRVLALPDVVTRALRASDEFVAEIPLDRARDKTMLDRMKLPPGQDLADLLPPELYARADRYLRTKGLRLRALADYQVWAVTTTLALVDYLPDLLLRPPLDQKLHDLARWHGLRTAGLETLDEQLAIFESLTMDEQVAWLVATLDALERAQQRGTSPSRQLVETYLRGDETALYEQMLAEYDPEDQRTQKLFAQIVTERNGRLAQRIEETIRARPQQSFFFAIGAGHLVGPDGVVARLRASGWGLTRLTRPDPAAVRR